MHAPMIEFRAKSNKNPKGVKDPKELKMTRLVQSLYYRWRCLWAGADQEEEEKKKEEKEEEEKWGRRQ